MSPMQPGERVTLIKKIAGRMAPDGIEEIRLTLGQFSLQIEWYYSDSNVIDPFTSVIRAIEGAHDQTLLDLHHHLFGSAAPSQGTRDATVTDETWAPNALRLFLSHTSQHKREVGLVRDMLAFHGVSAFVAHTDINPTRAWQDVIESALETCDALAAYMTPDFPQSDWTDQEVGFCVGRAILIIPIRAGLDPYGFIGKYQAMQGVAKAPAVIAAEMADILVDHPLTATRMAAPTAQSFARSYSFDNARANLERLERVAVGAWTVELADMVRLALRENSQLREGIAPTSTGPRPIPEIVTELLDRMTAQR